MLGDCLESAKDGVDEMVIVDTGSTDRTIEIAESYGAKILHFPWNGSFSDARNHGLEQATGTHILWLDADERLEEGDAARLRELAAQPWREAHWLVETNYTGQDEVGMAATHLALRLWRNRPHVPLPGRDPRADPGHDAHGAAGAVQRLEAADPPLRLPQGPHRGPRQARPQPRAAAEGARAQPERPVHPLQRRQRVRRHGRRQVGAPPLRAGAHPRPPRARLVGDRLRLAARLAPRSACAG